MLPEEQLYKSAKENTGSEQISQQWSHEAFLPPLGGQPTNKPEALKVTGYKTLKLYLPDNGTTWA